MIAIFMPLKMTSVRLHFKNTLPLGDKLLCQHLLEEVLTLDLPVYAMCSDAGIQEYLPRGVTFLQAEERLNNLDAVSMCQYFADCVPADIYALVHATAPFLRAETVRRGLEAVQASYDSACTVRRNQTFCWYNGRPVNYDLHDVPRTQDLQPVYSETNGCYIFRKGIIATGRRIGPRPFFLEVGSIEAVDIDTLEDFSLAQMIWHGQRLACAPL